MLWTGKKIGAAYMYMVSQIIAFLIAGFAVYGIYTLVVKLIPLRKKGEKIVK
jgi:large-conductance mechanosensitive channel